MKEQLEAILIELGAVFEWQEADTPLSVKVDKAYLHSFLSRIHSGEGLYFDMLSCITGVDNGPDAGTMEVVYNLTSLPFEFSLMVKSEIDRDNPEIESVSDTWKTAEWLERETYDLFGIRFTGHPDLRRILLPADWEGYPLRKDYQEQEYYHGIRVAY